jgi:hypothetical protein
MRTFAIVPTAGDDALTRNVRVELAQQDCDVVMAYNDGHLYDACNHAWRTMAEKETGPFNVAFVNTDVSFHGPVMADMARFLRSGKSIGCVVPLLDTDPRDDRPVQPIDGLRGYCFMVKGELIYSGLPMFFTGYSWYWGDTEFFRWLRLLGYGVWQVNTSCISHIGSASTPRGRGWQQRHHDDAELFAARMGDA